MTLKFTEMQYLKQVIMLIGKKTFPGKVKLMARGILITQKYSIIMHHGL